MPIQTGKSNYVEAPSSPLGVYLREINRTPLLSADEERELAIRIRRGDPEARDRMVRSNLRLVVKIARGYSARGVPLPDLVEEGNLGLLRAAERFDPDVGTRFSTYASFWIRQAIKRAILANAKTVRLPAYMVDLLNQWQVTSAQLEKALGRVPTHEEVARRLEIPINRLAGIRKALHVYQANTYSERTDDGVLLADILTDERVSRPDLAFMDNDSLELAYRIIESMDERAAQVVRMRFGLGDYKPTTLRQIGKSMGLSRERVRQIESQAISSLAAGLGACA